MIRILSSMLILLMFAFVISAQVYQQVPNAGSINWQDQIIKATGIGAPNPKPPRLN